MPELTPTELEYLRSQIPHTAIVKWYVAVAPYGDPCFTARIDGDPENNRTIEYDTGTSNNVNASDYSGLTLWVGSEAGAYDKGRIRIKSITGGGALPPPAGTIVVAENDGIDWSDGDYLTCPGAYGFRELWSKFPRLTENGAVTFYEDYDDTFSDPADVYLPPKANAGPPVIATLEGGYVDVEFMADESISLEVGHGIDEYEWDFADGVVQSWGDGSHMGTCEHPNIVRFSSTGFRYVKLTVRQNVAAEAGANRYASIYIPVWTFDDDDQPFTLQSIERFTADPGGSVTIKAFQSDTADEDVIYGFPDRAMVVVFTRTTYDGVDIEVGGYCHRENVEYVGWLAEESLRTNSEFGTIEFEAVDHIEILNQLNGWEFTLLDNDEPTDWYEIKDLNLDRSVHALLERRSTVNQIIHVNHVGDGSDRPVAIQPFPDTSLYRQIEDHLMADSMCTMLCGIQGMIHCTRDPQFMSEADRDLVDIVCHLTEDDVLNDLEEIKRHTPNIGYVKLGGFSYETPLMAEAPGTAPLQCHNSANVEGFIFHDQDEADYWAACWLAKENNPFPAVPVSLPGYWPVFDPAGQEFVELTYTDKLGRNVWNAQRFIVREVEHERLPIGGTGRTNIVLEMLTDPGDGVPVDVPDPPEPEPPPPVPDIPFDDAPEPTLAAMYHKDGIFVTDTWDELTPNWIDITHEDMETVFNAEWDHYEDGKLWALTGTENTDGDDQSDTQGLWYNADPFAPGAAASWTLVFTQEDGYDAAIMQVSCPCGGSRPPEPNWGQLRSMISSGPATAIVGEALWRGISWSPSTCERMSMLYEVDADGNATIINEQINGPGVVLGLMDGFTMSCSCCGVNSHMDLVCRLSQDFYWGTNQLSWRKGVKVCPAGEFLQVKSSFCDNNLDYYTQPFPRPISWIDDYSYYGGCIGSVFFGGRWFGLTSLDDAGGNGMIYDVWGTIHARGTHNNSSLCNMCTTPSEIWWCEPHTGAWGDHNNVLTAQGTPIGVTESDNLFGPTGAGGEYALIGHIRAMWTEYPWIAIVRKNPLQAFNPSMNVVWLYDITTGSVLNKTGTLNGAAWAAGDWGGAGTVLGTEPGNYNFSWDNVGISFPGGPLR